MCIGVHTCQHDDHFEGTFDTYLIRTPWYSSYRRVYRALCHFVPDPSGERSRRLANGSSFDESDDPVVSAAAFELAQILARKGIAADEIKITFSSSSEIPAPTTVHIQLLSLSESSDTLPDFDGLYGVFALLDLDEEEALRG
jgi:hypothetical protein